MIPEIVVASADQDDRKAFNQGSQCEGTGQSPLAKTSMTAPAEPMAAGVFSPTASSGTDARADVIAVILNMLETEDGMHWQAIDKVLSKLRGVPFGPYLAELRDLVQLGRIRRDGDRFWLNRPQ